MIDSLIDAVLIITLFQLLLLVTVLLLQKTTNTISRNLLVLFLLTKAFLNFRWSVFRFEFIQYQDHIIFYQLSSSVFLLLAPILYFYIKSICIKNFHFKYRDSLHIIPFSGLLLFKSLLVYDYYSENILRINNFFNFLFSNHWTVFWIINLFQILVYIVLMFRIFFNYQHSQKAIFTNGRRNNLNWLKSLLLLISLHWIFITSRALIALFSYKLDAVINLLDLFSIAIFLIFTTYLVIKGLGQLRILDGLPARSKYANSVLTEPVLTKYARELSLYMQSQKPYLNPEVTLEELSHKLSIPSWQLSQVINEYYQQNFFNYINSHRIEEAKKLLTHTNNGNKTVLEILYEVGFNSKSTFNSAFKKYTGVTPSQFKNSH